MHRNVFRWLLPAVCAVAVSAPQAQNVPRTAVPPNPLDASAAVPTLNFRSTLSGYRRLGDDKPIPWREANQTVGRIGGWRAYAREASEPESMPTESPAAPKAPAASSPPRSMPVTPSGQHTH